MDNITPYSDVSSYQESLTADGVGSAISGLTQDVQNTIDQDNLALVQNAAQTGEDLIRNQGPSRQVNFSHLDLRG